jgi:hypothetical protein
LIIVKIEILIGGDGLANHQKIMLAVIIAFLVFLLSACLQQETTVDNIYKNIEHAAIAEKGFEHAQDPLVETEKKEKALYNQIIELDSKQDDVKVKLSREALTMVNERKKYMKVETKSLQSSEKEFKKVSSLIAKIKDKNVRKQANDLYQLMIERFRAHEDLSKEYLNGTSQDLILYEMFQKKAISAEELDAQIDRINKTYKNIYTANDKFNLLTKQYNDQKLVFYKSAGLQKE